MLDRYQSIFAVYSRVWMEFSKDKDPASVKVFVGQNLDTGSKGCL